MDLTIKSRFVFRHHNGGHVVGQSLSRQSVSSSLLDVEDRQESASRHQDPRPIVNRCCRSSWSTWRRAILQHATGLSKSANRTLGPRDISVWDDTYCSLPIASAHVKRIPAGKSPRVVAPLSSHPDPGTRDMWTRRRSHQRASAWSNSQPRAVVVSVMGSTVFEVVRSDPNLR